MPVPWYAPAALDFGTKLLGGLIGGESEQDKLAKRRQGFEERQAADDRNIDLRERNQRLGSDAYKSPMKAALLNRMMGKVGIPTGGMGLPQGVMQYRQPQRIDPERERMMARFAPEDVIRRVEAARMQGPVAFQRYAASHPDTMRAYKALAGGR